MSRLSVIRLVFIALALGIGSNASAAVIWDEALNGDLNNTFSSPTDLGALTVGSNQVFGLTGRLAALADRDYFSISVPVGLSLTSIKFLGGETLGSVGFIGLGAGSAITVPPVPTPSNAAALLGWWHYTVADVGNDILPLMSTPNLFGSGNSGFTIPLGAGDYAFWVQDTSPTPIALNYGFELTVVPEPATISMMLLGLAGLGFLRRRPT